MVKLKSTLRVSFLISLCALSQFAYADYGCFLETKSYEVTIVSHCPEGDVSCADVTYSGKRKSDSAELTLKGNSLNRSTTQDLYGYSFKNKQYEYIIIFNRDKANFYIKRDNKVIADEEGKCL